MKARNSFLGAFIATVVAIYLALSSHPRSAESYTPPQAGITYPVYATPALLAAASVTGLTIGAQAWVTNQGVWSYNLCSSTCDQANTCRLAAGNRDGGYGTFCWNRSTDGIFGFQNLTAAYVNASTGSDTNDGMTAGTALATLTEFQLRLANQVVNSEFVINVVGSFPNFAGSLYVNPVSPGTGYLLFLFTPVTVGADGGPFWQGTIAGFTPWDAGAIETLYVTPTGSSPTFNPTSWPADAGWVMQDTSQCNTAGIGCSILQIGYGLDAGQFETPGPNQVFSFGTTPNPAPGDTVQMVQLPQLTTNGTSELYIAGGSVNLANVMFGAPSQFGLVGFIGPAGYVEVDNSIAFGVVNQGVGQFGLAFYGTSFYNALHSYGGNVFAQNCYADEVTARQTSTFNLSQTLIGTGGIRLGGTSSNIPQGPSYGIFGEYGPVACEHFTLPCLQLANGSNAMVAGPFICSNAVGSVPCVQTYQGGNYVAYSATSDFHPIGTVYQGIWEIGGTFTDAGLPQTCSSSAGCGIVAFQ